MKFEDCVLVLLMKFREPKRIAELLNVRLEDVIRVLEKLEVEGLVERKRKGFIIKKEVYELTAKGFEEAQRLIREIEKTAEDLKLIYERDPEKVKTVVSESAFLLPVLLALGLADFLIFSSLVDDMDVLGDFDFDIDQVEF